MIGITDEAYAAVLDVLGRLPMNQIEQVMIAVRSGIKIPDPIALDITREVNLRTQATLQKQLAQLGTLTPPGKQAPTEKTFTPEPGATLDSGSNGQADNPPT